MNLQTCSASRKRECLSACGRDREKISTTKTGSEYACCTRGDQRFRWGEYRNAFPPRQVLKSDRIRGDSLRWMVGLAVTRRFLRVSGTPVRHLLTGST